MGFTLETGISCLVSDGEIPVGYSFDCCIIFGTSPPDGEIPVGYSFDCCCFIFGTSPPGYESGGDESEEARRGLLKKVCSQERAISYNINRTWSDSTSVRKPILLN
jgi:hypothetical protein